MSSSKRQYETDSLEPNSDGSNSIDKSRKRVLTDKQESSISNSASPSNELQTSFSNNNNTNNNNSSANLDDDFTTQLKGKLRAPATLISRSDSSSALSALASSGWRRSKSTSTSLAGTPKSDSLPTSRSQSPVPNAIPTTVSTTSVPTNTDHQTPTILVSTATNTQPITNTPTSNAIPTASNSNSTSTSTSAPASSQMTEVKVNQIAAKLMKAEMMGDEDKIAKLKQELESARAALASQQQLQHSTFNPILGSTITAPSSSTTATRPSKPARKRDDNNNNEENNETVDEIISGTTDKSGQLRPLPSSYKKDVRSLLEQERLKSGDVEDYDADFAKSISKMSKNVSMLSDDYDIGDEFEKKSRAKENPQSKKDKNKAGSQEEHAQQKAIRDHQKHQSILETCPYCLETSNHPQYLTIATGINCYLSLPLKGSLTEGHCIIVPIQHTISGTEFDEDVADEIQLFKKFLTKMFAAQDKDVVFLENVQFLKRQHHTKIDCIPLARDLGEVAPMYFKKAIIEAESEWQQNKKIIDTKGKNIRACVPKGFPYFHVEFALDFGYAHVIDNELKFPQTFGFEVVGGLLELEPHCWTNPKPERFDKAKTLVAQFKQMWHPFDWTRRLTEKGNEEK